MKILTGSQDRSMSIRKSISLADHNNSFRFWKRRSGSVGVPNFVKIGHQLLRIMLWKIEQMNCKCVERFPWVTEERVSKKGMSKEKRLEWVNLSEKRLPWVPVCYFDYCFRDYSTCIREHMESVMLRNNGEILSDNDSFNERVTKYKTYSNVWHLFQDFVFIYLCGDCSFCQSTAWVVIFDIMYLPSRWILPFKTFILIKRSHILLFLSTPTFYDLPFFKKQILYTPLIFTEWFWQVVLDAD